MALSNQVILNHFSLYILVVFYFKNFSKLLHTIKYIFFYKVYFSNYKNQLNILGNADDIVTFKLYNCVNENETPCMHARTHTHMPLSLIVKYVIELPVNFEGQ